MYATSLWTMTWPLTEHRLITPTLHLTRQSRAIEPEVIDLASAPRMSFVGSRVSWHPKLTLYRLLVILSTVGLAIAKTATSYLNLTFASITLEWILGVVVFLL